MGEGRPHYASAGRPAPAEVLAEGQRLDSGSGSIRQGPPWQLPGPVPRAPLGGPRRSSIIAARSAIAANARRVDRCGSSPGPAVRRLAPWVTSWRGCQLLVARIPCTRPWVRGGGTGARGSARGHTHLPLGVRRYCRQTLSRGRHGNRLASSVQANWHHVQAPVTGSRATRGCRLRVTPPPVCPLWEHPPLPPLALHLGHMTQLPRLGGDGEGRPRADCTAVTIGP